MSKVRHEPSWSRGAGAWGFRAAVVSLITGALLFSAVPAATAQQDPEPAPSPTTETPAPEDPAEEVTDGKADESVEPPVENESEAQSTDDKSTEAEPTPEKPQEKSPGTRSQNTTPQPLAAGPDGAQPPYVYWETRVDPGNALQGSATYQLDGPRTSSPPPWWNVWDDEVNISWNNTVSVPDCTSAPCAGPDLDPDPGEYLVKQIGSHTISSENRYRVKQVTPPAGFSFVNTADPWVEIPGTRNTPTGWSANSTYDFGDFMVRKLPPSSPTCETGWVYGLSGDGQLRQVSPGNAVTNLGTKASGVSNFNGLGIGSGGDPVYAIERSGSSGTSISGTVWKYNTTTGVWASTGHTTGGSTGTNLVGGAVNLANGRYYFGGFQGNGNFKVYEYNPTANPAITHKGTIVSAATSSANGDMAFNANGDLFVVRGSGNTTEIYSVTAADFAAASGGSNIPSSRSSSFQTMPDVNGVAFDSNGRVYLGSGSALRSYAMPDWSDQVNRLTSGLNSTDLATCASPPTVTLEKYVEGGRLSASHQFALTLRQGTTVLGTATTSGNSTGLQSQHVGPLPTSRGVTLSFSEAASGMPDLSQYSSRWSCTVDGEPIPNASGTGTSGTVTIPTTGQDINCRFTNAPLTASVTINKQIRAQDGTLSPAKDWVVGATASATPGNIVGTPASAEQPTNAQGNASWDFLFNNPSGVAQVGVSEQMQSGFDFHSGSCEIVSLNGAKRDVTLAAPSAQTLTGVVPGDRVYCQYVNKSAPKLTLVKKVENPAAGSGYAAATDWKLTATGTGSASGTAISGATGTAAVTSKTVPSGKYDLTEAFSGNPDKSPGYRWSNLVCTNATGNVVFSKTPASGTPVTAASVTLQHGDDVTCTYSNTPSKGSVEWKKVDTNGDALSGSEWKLSVPGVPGNTVVTDCTQATCPAGAYKDQDPAAGEFLVKELVWGSYTLTESKAPAGYRLDDTPRTFTISHSSIDHKFGAGFVNKQIDPPDLPFTGGWFGRDEFAILGLGILILGGGTAIAIQVRKRRREVA